MFYAWILRLSPFPAVNLKTSRNFPSLVAPVFTWSDYNPPWHLWRFLYSHLSKERRGREGRVCQQSLSYNLGSTRILYMDNANIHNCDSLLRSLYHPLGNSFLLKTSLFFQSSCLKTILKYL